MLSALIDPCDWQKSDRWLIAALTDHPDPNIHLISYELPSPTATPVLKEISTAPLHSRNTKAAEHISSLTIGPAGSLILAAVYFGKMSLVRVLERNEKVYLSDVRDFKCVFPSSTSNYLISHPIQAHKNL